MSLEKVKVVIGTNITEGGVIEVKEQVRILEDGNVLSATTHRYTIEPTGQPPEDASEQIKAVCAVVHTEECKANYMASQAVE